MLTMCTVRTTETSLEQGQMSAANLTKCDIYNLLLEAMNWKFLKSVHVENVF